MEKLDPKTGAIISSKTFAVPKSVEDAHPSPEPVLYGTEVKLEHVNTRARLHSAEGETCVSLFCHTTHAVAHAFVAHAAFKARALYQTLREPSALCMLVSV